MIKKVLPLLAAFLAGIAVATVSNVSADTPCDWSFRSSTQNTIVIPEDGHGAATARQALLGMLETEGEAVTVTRDALESEDGTDRAVEIGVDEEGGVGFNIFPGDTHRIIARVAKLDEVAPRRKGDPSGEPPSRRSPRERRPLSLNP